MTVTRKFLGPLPSGQNLGDLPLVPPGPGIVQADQDLTGAGGHLLPGEERDLFPLGGLVQSAVDPGVVVAQKLPQGVLRGEVPLELAGLPRLAFLNAAQGDGSGFPGL